jgi:hypothetical protein
MDHAGASAAKCPLSVGTLAHYHSIPISPDALHLETVESICHSEVLSFEYIFAPQSAT